MNEFHNKQDSSYRAAEQDKVSQAAVEVRDVTMNVMVTLVELLCGDEKTNSHVSRLVSFTHYVLG